MEVPGETRVAYTYQLGNPAQGQGQGSHQQIMKAFTTFGNSSKIKVLTYIIHEWIRNLKTKVLFGQKSRQSQHPTSKTLW